MRLIHKCADPPRDIGVERRMKMHERARPYNFEAKPSIKLHGINMCALTPSDFEVEQSMKFNAITWCALTLNNFDVEHNMRAHLR